MTRKNRTEYIGARFTEKERKFIEKTAEKHNLNLSELTRQALFSHITFLDQFKDNTKSKIGESFILVSL